MTTEYTVYLMCAIVGCSLVGLQVILQLFGFIGDVDFDDAHHDIAVESGDSPDGHGNLFFGILSFKAITAFVGVFGLVGLILVDSDFTLLARAGISFGSGVVAMFGIAQMMLGLVRLQASGSVDIRNAIGATARVYLRIPAAGEGRGKVTVTVQGRSMECAAMSDGPAIATGGMVKVVSVEGDALRVTPA